MGININTGEILNVTNANINTLIESVGEITALLNEVEDIVKEDNIVGIEKVIIEQIELMNEFIENEYLEVIQEIEQAIKETTNAFVELDNETKRSL